MDSLLLKEINRMPLQSLILASSIHQMLVLKICPSISYSGFGFVLKLLQEHMQKAHYCLHRFLYLLFMIYSEICFFLTCISRQIIRKRTAPLEKFWSKNKFLVKEELLISKVNSVSINTLMWIGLFPLFSIKMCWWNWMTITGMSWSFSLFSWVVKNLLK